MRVATLQIKARTTMRCILSA